MRSIPNPDLVLVDVERGTLGGELLRDDENEKNYCQIATPPGGIVRSPTSIFAEAEAGTL